MIEHSDIVHLAGATLARSRHVCAFHRGPDEAYEILLPFVKEGLDRHEKVVHIIDARTRDDYSRRLHDFHIDPGLVQRSGQLEVRGWEDAYFRGGQFEQERMIAFIEESLTGGHDAGYSLTRLVAHMEWSVVDHPGVSDLVEYETRLNYVLPNYPDPVVYMYDLGRYSAGIVMDILRTHPTVIIGGVLQDNPFFVQPDQLLLELGTRASSFWS